jgi:hypothetical protein
MGELTHILQQSLDADVAPALKAANLRGDGELVLLCASSSWAARLRFEADRLVAAAKAAGLDVQRCRVAVCRDR